MKKDQHTSPGQGFLERATRNLAYKKSMFDLKKSNIHLTGEEMILALFGWKAGPEEYPPAELMEYAIAAEHAGFGSFDVSDHFAPWSEAGQTCFPRSRKKIA